jgi:hypothetical protein
MKTKAPKRNHATDPHVGDVMEWKGYVVEVNMVEDGVVHYSVAGNGVAPRVSQQDLARWSHWTPKARLREPGECTVLAMVSGACSKCGRGMDPAHYSSGALTCAACCVGNHKAKRRSRLDQKTAGA